MFIVRGREEEINNSIAKIPNEQRNAGKMPAIDNPYLSVFICTARQTKSEASSNLQGGCNEFSCDL
jgi:hypothetical protein